MEKEEQRKTEQINDLFRLREEVRLLEGHFIQQQANLLILQDRIATLLKSRAFLEPTPEQYEAIEAEINQSRKQLEDLIQHCPSFLGPQQ